MTVFVGTPEASDLDALTALAASCQAHGERYCAYLAVAEDAIRHEVTHVDRWRRRSTVAKQDGRPTGWLLAETDPDMDRVWWWGPFVARDAAPGTADRLYDHGRSLLEQSYTEEEMAPDVRNRTTTELAIRNDFVAETASVVLTLRRSTEETTDPRVRGIRPADHDGFGRLHEMLFAGTHSTSSHLLASLDAEHLLLVAEESGAVAGYVACAIQRDGSGYIDYLGVDPDLRRRGLGIALVDAAATRMRAAGADPVHLTVRESNTAARRLYGRLGFEEERLIRPYRKGFRLDDQPASISG